MVVGCHGQQRVIEVIGQVQQKPESKAGKRTEPEYKSLVFWGSIQAVI